MSSMRRVTILEGMFLDVCSDEDRKKVDELYEEGCKGSAVVYMLKRVRAKWIELINQQPAYTVKERSLGNEERGLYLKRIMV